MTVEWFDLGLRLHAAHTAQPAPRLTHSPIVTGHAPVAVRATHDGTTTTVTAATADHAPATATNRDALDLLADLGASITAPEPVTLLTDTTETLPALRRLSDLSRPGHSTEATAAYIGWCLDRADFPTGRAVADLIAAARARWALGTAPTAETNPATWRSWLNITDPSATGLLDLHAAITTAPALPSLTDLEEDDLYAYSRAQADHANQIDWRGPDARARAALGLRSRCDAAEVYDSALLTDPAHRSRGVHTGHVITGTADAHPDRRTFTVRADRLDARTRPGHDVTGWTGTPTTPGETLTGTVTATHADGDTLVLTIKHATAAETPNPGDPITLHDLPVTPASQRWRRKRFGGLYKARRSWLTTGRQPEPTRRDVPLDVLVAGADDEEA